jgi:hypothetical protein
MLFANVPQEFGEPYRNTFGALENINRKEG